MRINMVGAFIRNKPFGTEIAFAKGFERLGHDVKRIDPDYPDQVWDYGADATVIFKWIEGADNIANLSACMGPKIVYQPDDLRFPHIQQMMRGMRGYCDYALTFDETGALLAQNFGYLKSEHLLLTADDELYRPLPGVVKDIDVSFIGSLTAGPNHTSRVKMCQIVGKMGLKVCFATDIYEIEDIVRVYNRSKIVLNHATDVGQEFGHGFGYQCRHFEAGMTGACVLSNKVDSEVELHNIEEFASEAELVGKVRYLLENEKIRHANGDHLLREIRARHLPQHRALQMIDFVRSL